MTSFPLLDGTLPPPTGLVGVLGVGLLLGLRHALDPDHVVVVTTLATRQPRLRDACRLGFAWSLGHSASVIAVIAAIVALDLHLPDRLWAGADFLVGLLLVVLGVSVIVDYRRGRFHLHVHGHDGAPDHLHLHSHAHGVTHRHPHPRGDARRSFGFGLLHGLAGSAAILVLLITTTHGRVAQFACLGAFVSGTIISMVLVSLAVAAAVRRAATAGTDWVRLSCLGSAAASIVVGVQLALAKAPELA